jgi:hypothetical protein
MLIKCAQITIELYCCSSQWGETMSLNCGHQRVYCPSPRWYMSTESHGGIILTGETKELGDKPDQCHFVHHTSHVDWPWCKAGPPQGEASDKLPEPWHALTIELHIIKNVLLEQLVSDTIFTWRTYFTVGMKSVASVALVHKAADERRITISFSSPSEQRK